MTVLIINISNWILPGIYTLTYEICSCISQDHSQHIKFENTSLIISLSSLLVYAYVTVRIKIYKKKMRMTIAPVGPKQTVNNQIQKKELLTDLTKNIGTFLLVIAIFGFSYILSKTNPSAGLNHQSFNNIQLYYLFMIPVVLNLFVISFYARNENAKIVILRECSDTLTLCRGQ